MYINVNRFSGIQEHVARWLQIGIGIGIASRTGLGKATCCGTFSAGQQDLDCVGLFVCLLQQGPEGTCRLGRSKAGFLKADWSARWVVEY